VVRSPPARQIQSEAAKRLGQQPKKIVDRVTTDVGKAMQQGQGRTPEEEEPSSA